MPSEIYDSMPECDYTLFFRLNPILHCSLYSVLIPWINTWSGGYLCLLISIFCSFLLRVLLRFYFILFLLYPFSSMLSESLSLHLGVYWGMTEVLTWEMKCATFSLEYWIIDSKVLPVNYRNLEHASLKFGSITHHRPWKNGRNSGSLIFVSVRKWEFILQLMILMEAALLPFSADLIIIWRGITNFE